MQEQAFDLGEPLPEKQPKKTGRENLRPGGRPKGSPNKITVEVRALALEYGPAAIAEAARLMKHARSEAVRVAAINTILERAYGKARQAVELTGKDGGPVQYVDSVNARDILIGRIASIASRNGANDNSEELDGQADRRTVVGLEVLGSA